MSKYIDLLENASRDEERYAAVLLITKSLKADADIGTQLPRVFAAVDTSGFLRRLLSAGAGDATSRDVQYQMQCLGVNLLATFTYACPAEKCGSYITEFWDSLLRFFSSQVDEFCRDAEGKAASVKHTSRGSIIDILRIASSHGGSYCGTLSNDVWRSVCAVLDHGVQDAEDGDLISGALQFVNTLSSLCSSRESDDFSPDEAQASALLKSMLSLVSGKPQPLHFEILASMEYLLSLPAVKQALVSRKSENLQAIGRFISKLLRSKVKPTVRQSALNVILMASTAVDTVEWLFEVGVHPDDLETDATTATKKTASPVLGVLIFSLVPVELHVVLNVVKTTQRVTDEQCACVHLCTSLVNHLLRFLLSDENVPAVLNGDWDTVDKLSKIVLHVAELSMDYFEIADDDELLTSENAVAHPLFDFLCSWLREDTESMRQEVASLIPRMVAYMRSGSSDHVMRCMTTLLPSLCAMSYDDTAREGLIRNGVVHGLCAFLQPILVKYGLIGPSDVELPSPFLESEEWKGLTDVCRKSVESTLSEQADDVVLSNAVMCVRALLDICYFTVTESEIAWYGRSLGCVLWLALRLRVPENVSSADPMSVLFVCVATCAFILLRTISCEMWATELAEAIDVPQFLSFLKCAAPFVGDWIASANVVELAQQIGTEEMLCSLRDVCVESIKEAAKNDQVVRSAVGDVALSSLGRISTIQ